ncbi:zinc metallopeptidase [candidate division KSB1 bacterium]|nr:zinc metallopeptidase [candidate division KSB1 bacterium]RQW02003.1 MAG: zinc metallopeptidase [candidate division KSB1 bacterium]
MFFLPLDGTIILLVPAILLSIYAQFAIRSSYAKWSKVRSAVGMTGAQVAKQLLLQNGINDVDVEEIGGSLSDHYDSRAKKLRLSTNVYRSNSLAALGVAAHETGHAIQHAKSYAPLNIRQALFPVASIGSTWGFWIFLIGMFISSFRFLMDVGILLFAAAALFQIVTLPVEFNASSRALAQLSDGGYLRADEVNGAKKVLNAAALTYVSAAAMSVLTLVRLLILRGDD